MSAQRWDVAEDMKCSCGAPTTQKARWTMAVGTTQASSSACSCGRQGEGRHIVRNVKVQGGRPVVGQEGFKQYCGQAKRPKASVRPSFLLTAMVSQVSVLTWSMVL